MRCAENIIGHQVNCRGTMGAGLAKLIKDTYPFVFKQYKAACDLMKPHKLLGECQIVWHSKGKGVANLFAQLNYGRSKDIYTDYNALRKALVELKHISEVNSVTVALPYNLGCGLANGEWSVVMQIIEEVFSDNEVTLYRLI